MCSLQLCHQLFGTNCHIPLLVFYFVVRSCNLTPFFATDFGNLCLFFFILCLSFTNFTDIFKDNWDLLLLCSTSTSSSMISPLISLQAFGWFVWICFFQFLGMKTGNHWCPAFLLFKQQVPTALLHLCSTCFGVFYFYFFNSSLTLFEIFDR